MMGMDTNAIKANLQKYYNEEAPLRNGGEKDEWKQLQRTNFYNVVKAENKNTLLEIGAGTGDDSLFFMERGLCVTATDLTPDMVKICKEKAIEAYELDFYNVADLGRTFDCVWSMNSLLHVPKADLPQVLAAINGVLNENGLFYMGVYGGVDTESEFVNDVSETPRFFSYYSERALREVLSRVFDVVDFKQFDVGRNVDFQAVVMRRR